MFTYIPVSRECLPRSTAPSAAKPLHPAPSAASRPRPPQRPLYHCPLRCLIPLLLDDTYYEIYVQLQLLGCFIIARNIMIRQLKSSIDAIYGLFWETINFKPGFLSFPLPDLGKIILKVI
jgi:hypothetical protein